MALRTLAGRWRAGAAVAAAIAAGGTVAYCEDPKGVGFDPEALERGAKALREINKSPYAKKVFELTREQERTKQAEASKDEAQYKVYAEQQRKETEKARWEEQRKTMQQDAQAKAQLAQYEDELARKRGESEHQKNRERNRELVTLQEQSVRNQEAEKRRIQEQIEGERRATEKYKANLEKEVEREKALAEAEGRIKENRENEDVNRRAMQLRLEEERKKLVEAINTTFTNLGSGTLALLTDKEKLGTALAGLTVLALGVYSAREGTRVAGQVFSRWLGTPKLVRDTSRRWFWQRGASATKSSQQVKKDFSDIVLPGQMHDHVRALAAVTANTKSHGAPFRHMLFYGPPGTGKTMAAKRLAKTSGLDYAIMSGGDVAPLGGQAVTQLHDMFDWAERSRRGLLLFIDEADAFLSQRGQQQMSEGLRGALNAVLFRTGDQSRDFAVVLATNRPGDLDSAILDRMDEALEFGLPGLSERQQILSLYLDQYIFKAGTVEGGAGAASSRGLWQRFSSMLRGRSSSPDQIQVETFTPEMLQEAAQKTEGFSGRELAKLMASMQAAVYGSAQPTLTHEMWHRVLNMKVREHSQRQAFLDGHHTVN
ncbi:MAG: ATPase family AAA domain-containing 3-B-like [Trebouxia sp. A1-2]|nr:MAG: ATPase family AAA domain-containing 3-B-like [Trebouxia sp. A1-2]